MNLQGEMIASYMVSAYPNLKSSHRGCGLAHCSFRPVCDYRHVWTPGQFLLVCLVGGPETMEQFPLVCPVVKGLRQGGGVHLSVQSLAG